MNPIMNGICSPDWFLWKDITIDAVILIIMLFMLNGIIEYKKLSNKKECFHSLFIGFILISASFVLKIVVNSVLYHINGFPGWNFWNMHFHDALLVLGYMTTRILFSIGILYLYAMYYKPNRHSVFLISILIFIALYFTITIYYVWHVILSLFLLLVSVKSIQRAKEIKSILRDLTAISFVLFLLSQLFFMFLEFNLVFYVIGEFLQLIGYVCMASIFIVVKNYGKKKKSVRHCC